MRPQWDHNSNILAKSKKNPQILSIWKVSEDDVTLQEDLGEKEHEDQIWDISLSPDKKILVVGFGMESVTIWNFQTMEKIIDRRGCSYVQLTNSSFQTVFSKDSSLFAVKTAQGIIVYKSLDQEMLGVFPYKDHIFSVSISEDNSKIAIGLKDKAFVYEM